MCGRKETFVELKEEVCGKVSLRDSSKLTVECIGFLVINRHWEHSQL
jgi:hypothetical protein